MNIKMLYIGGLNSGSTGKKKYEEFKKNVSNIEYIDTDIYKYKDDVISKLNHRNILKNRKNLLNKYIIEKTKGKNYDLIYLSKADWIFKETILYLKEKTKLIVHYTPDAAIIYNKTKDFIESINYYDYLFTTKEWELNDYYKYVESKDKVILTYQGVDLDYFRPDKSIKKNEDVIFIGRKEKHYKDIIEYIYRNNINICVYGNQWKNGLMRSKKYVKGGNLVGIDYRKKINASKIGLGLLSKLFPETNTTRTFEITSSGVLLLAERTEQHLALFEEDKEAVYFESKEELCSKIKYYLKNDSLREEIAGNGRLRCIKSGYSNKDFIFKVLNLLTL